MSTINASDIYPGSAAQSPATLEQSSGAGDVATARLPMAAWVAFVVILIVIRLLWEMSE